MPDSPPAACTLTPAQLRADRDALLPGLVGDARIRSPLPDGMRFVFTATAQRLRQLHALVQRRCCELLDIRVGMTPGGAYLTLDVTGPDGTRDFLAALLEDDASTAA